MSLRWILGCVLGASFFEGWFWEGFGTLLGGFWEDFEGCRPIVDSYFALNMVGKREGYVAKSAWILTVADHIVDSCLHHASKNSD